MKKFWDFAMVIAFNIHGDKTEKKRGLPPAPESPGPSDHTKNLIFAGFCLIVVAIVCPDETREAIDVLLKWLPLAA